MIKLRVDNNNDAEPPPELRAIALLNGRLGQNLDEIEQALIEQRIGVFQRNGELVMPGAVSIEVRDGNRIEAIGLIEVSAGSLVEIITVAAMLAKYNEKRKGMVPANCPLNVADAYMKRKGRWELRPLAGITNAPTLRRDGSLLDQLGYDPGTGLLYMPQPDVEFPPIPNNPTRADALKALSVLEELICAYPFVSPEAHSVALAAMLTGLIRRMLPTAPGFAFTSPVPGSGKGLLCDTIAYLSHGHQPSSLTQGNEEETEKRISSALMRGDPVMVIDNITQPITGAKLLSVLTQQVADLRPLGSSKLVGHDTRALIMFNGNNLTIPGDSCRRLLVCGIDPRTENPERRRFDFDPLERAKQNRGRYVAAGLTILRAYFLERQWIESAPFLGFPQEAAADPLGSYVEWSRWVRDALLWLGQPDPVATIDISKSVDPEAEQIGAVLRHWAEVIGVGARITVKGVIRAAMFHTVDNSTTHDPFDQGSEEERKARDAFIDVLNGIAAPMVRGGMNDRVCPRRLGNWLSKYTNRVVGGLRIVRLPEKHHGDTLWRLEQVG